MGKPKLQLESVVVFVKMAFEPKCRFLSNFFDKLPINQFCPVLNVKKPESHCASLKVYGQFSETDLSFFSGFPKKSVFFGTKLKIFEKQQYVQVT